MRKRYLIIGFVMLAVALVAFCIQSVGGKRRYSQNVNLAGYTNIGATGSYGTPFAIPPAQPGPPVHRTGVRSGELTNRASLAPHDKPPESERVYRGKTLQAWFNELRDYDPEPTIQALRELSPDSVAFLAAQLRKLDSPPKAAYLALWPKLPATLKSKLRQPFSALPGRRRAVMVLRGMGPPFTKSDLAFAALTAALNDPDDEVRSMAQGAIGDIGPQAKAAVGALIQSVRRRTDLINGIYALGRIGPDAKAALPVLETIVTTRSGRERVYAAEALVKIGGSRRTGIEALLNELHGTNAHARAEAALALKLSGPEAKAVAPALISALQDSDQLVRFNAATALAAMGLETKEAVAVLTKEAASDEPFGGLGLLAAEALLGVSADSSVALARLRRALHDQQEGVRFHAACTLGMKGKDADLTVPILVQALQAPDQRWQLVSVKALAKLGPQAQPAWEALTAAAHGTNEELKEAANEALRALRGQENSR